MDLWKRAASLYGTARSNPRRFALEHLSTIALLTGFIWDNLTLSRVDAWYDTAVVVSYLIIAAGCVFLINVTSIGRFARISPWLPAAAQFAFGGLFSSYVVYYSRTGSWLGGWPFLITLVALLIGNEFFKSRYQSFVFHTSVLFVALFSFLIFYLPVIGGTMGAGTFLLSGAFALIFIWLFYNAVKMVAPVRAKESGRSLATAIGGIFLAFNLLYFSNAIPPLPLSLHDLRIAHSITRTGEGNYALSVERQHLYTRLPFVDEVFHTTAGARIYAFSAVFAPGRLSVPIYHVWQRYSETTGTWVDMTRVRFPINGGRDTGYRGFSYKDAIETGDWRIAVETERGALLGRTYFRVERTGEVPMMVTIER